MAKCIKVDDLIPLLDWDHDEQSWYINPEELEHLEENAVDAVPVVHARWKMTDSPYCSRCNRIAVMKYKFCPNCGARMDGEKNAAD